METALALLSTYNPLVVPLLILLLFLYVWVIGRKIERYETSCHDRTKQINSKIDEANKSIDNVSDDIARLCTCRDIVIAAILGGLKSPVEILKEFEERPQSGKESSTDNPPNDDDMILS